MTFQRRKFSTSRRLGQRRDVSEDSNNQRRDVSERCKINVATFHRIVIINVATFQRGEKSTPRSCISTSRRYRDWLNQRRDVDIQRRDITEKGNINVATLISHVATFQRGGQNDVATSRCRNVDTS